MVANSKWAILIFPVIKSNWKIRIFGDFKVTLNKCLNIEKYPLPKIEEMLTTLGGILHFAK